MVRPNGRRSLIGVVCDMKRNKFGFSTGVLLGAGVLALFGLFNLGLVLGMIGTSLAYEYRWME